jgi:hypothetical protein
MSEHAAAIAQIEGLIAELSEQMREPASPRLHQEQDRGLDYAEQLLIALRADDAEDLSRVEDERLKAPRGLREYAAVERYVQVRHDVGGLGPMGCRAARAARRRGIPGVSVARYRPEPPTWPAETDEIVDR